MSPEFRGTRHVKPEYKLDLSKIPVANIGIEETVDVIELLQPCAGIAGEVLGRRFGWLSIKRLWQAWKLWRRAKAAIKGIGGVPKELLNLDAKEKAKLAAEAGEVVQEFFIGFYGQKVVKEDATIQ